MSEATPMPSPSPSAPPLQLHPRARRLGTTPTHPTHAWRVKYVGTAPFSAAGKTQQVAKANAPTAAGLSGLRNESCFCLTQGRAANTLTYARRNRAGA